MKGAVRRLFLFLGEALATALARVAESEDWRLEMGKRSREIVARFSCGNFAKQAMRAACAARQA